MSGDSAAAGLTAEDVERLRDLLTKATPGAWKLWGMTVLADQDGTSNVDTAVPVAQTYHRDEHDKPRTWDASLIAESHNLLPALLDALAATEDEVNEWKARHRDLTSRLGFGDNITEPQADNDTIIKWFDEQGRDANEWQESQLWRLDCYEKGHSELDDCYECDPRLSLVRERDEARAAVERVEAAIHKIADELDVIDGNAWVRLGGVSLGGAIRHELRDALNPQATDGGA